MTRDDQHVPISPGLPILDELGDVLRRDFARREQSRHRRRRVAAAAVAGALTVIAATTIALVGDRTEPARAVQIATGQTADASWQLVLVDSDSGPCLQLRPRDKSDSVSGPCVPRRTGPADSSAARTSFRGQSFVYGFSSPSTPAVRVSSAGRTEQVPTELLPRAAQELHIVPARVRIYVAPVPGDNDDAVTIEPQGPGNSDLVIRVPNAPSP